MDYGSKYWESRRHLRYYSEVVRLARVYCPKAQSAIDVGCLDTLVLSDLDWIPKKVAVDLMMEPKVPGAININGNFFSIPLDEQYDLGMCLQVLEHLPEPGPQAMARKLLSLARITIISVPYKWPQGKCRAHIHDPVDEETMASWTNREPSHSLVADERLICVYSA